MENLFIIAEKADSEEALECNVTLIFFAVNFLPAQKAPAVRPGSFTQLPRSLCLFAEALRVGPELDRKSVV